MKRERKLPPLRAVQAFEAAARLGHFTRAAEELHVTQTAISHQVRVLETFFEQKLFDRSTRDVVVTESGARLLAACTDALDLVDRASRDLLSSGVGDSSPLRITLPPAMGSRWLAPRLGQFWSEQAIELNLIPSTTVLDFQRDNIDAGIRCGDGNWTGLEAEYLMPMAMTPVCAPLLLQEKPGLATPADLEHHVLLHEINYDAWGEWLATHDLSHIDHQHGTICQDASMLYDFAIRGQGVAIGSETVLRAELDRGSLVAPFDDNVDTQGAYYLVYRKSSLQNERVRFFRDFVLRQSVASSKNDLST